MGFPTGGYDGSVPKAVKVENTKMLNTEAREPRNTQVSDETGKAFTGFGGKKTYGKGGGK